MKLNRFWITVSLIAASALAIAKVTTPKEFFGHDVCEDYWLANYKQMTAYWQQLDKESDRMTLVSIGKTEEGREQYMAIISDPANLRSLDTHRRNSRRFAMARSLSKDQAENLAKTAKAVVWIDGGLHATEVLVAQQLIETSFQLLSRDDEENRRILKDCIILLAHANPDGMDLVADWYMRKADPKSRSFSLLPRLYQKYIGHDNNRDFYANNMAETRNINRVLYKEWSPQIVYNHHQSAPSGTIMYIPPFRNPFNYHVDPLVQIATDVVGMHMHHRLIGEGKGGTIMRSGAPYSTWWNGGLRTTTYFHNMIGILTETWGSPSPTEIPFSPNRQIPIADQPMPIDTRVWHLRDSLAYEVSANYAVLDYASRYREQLLMDIWKMASGQVERGKRDTWTRYPSRLLELGRRALSDPDLRDPKMYVMPIDQPDAGSLRWFIRRLDDCGVEIERTTAPVTVNGKPVPAGSYVVRLAQPFRAHILDMFEPQDHPNDFQYPGGPPIPPYDSAGYTLAFQMGIRFERVLDMIHLPTQPMEAAMTEISNPHLADRSSLADIGNYAKLNRHLELGKTAWIKDGTIQLQLGPGSGTAPFELTRRPRIALWDVYGGSMTSGWTRWIFEQFGMDFKVLFPPDFDRGNLIEQFDVVILPNGAIPARLREGSPPGSNDETIPADLRARMGFMNAKSIAALKEFCESGGHVVAIGDSAANLATHLDLPVVNALTETDGQGNVRSIPTTKFYVPGSLLGATVARSPLSMGISDRIDFLFDESPAFKWRGEDRKGAHAVAWFDSEKPLRSGWAWGQALLKDTLAVIDVPFGKGYVVLCGPEVLFRAQPTQTFKFVFNAILRSGAKAD